MPKSSFIKQKMALFNKIATNILKSTNVRTSSSAAQAIQMQEELLQPFRTKESNPANHNVQHLNRFYTIPPEQIQTLFCHGLPGEYKKQMKTFAEMCILIRKPAVELLNYLRQTDFSKPVNKYVIYGESGCGKTTTLLHALHYGLMTKKIIVNIHNAQLWFKHPKEVAASTTKEGLLDLPIDAATWLLNFKNQNSSLLAQIDLKLSKSHEWSSREKSPKGSSLIELIDLGISRVKYASDIINILIEELKQASIAGKCKILVAVEGFNAFFSTYTQIKDDTKQRVTPFRVSLTEAFLNITKSDWCNGQIVLTVDPYAVKDRRDSYFPRYLLGENGFNHLDPFLPISVENYSDDEFETVIEYYKNRKWIRHLTPEGQKELKLVSGCNPYKLMEYCKSL